jgi:glutamate--cysteine ligase
MTYWLNDYPHLLAGGLKGIEKESLRINTQGLIAQTQHPYALGSALTHPQITTDYSEALIELITPPFANIHETLDAMQKIHQFVYENLVHEHLLCASMPCGIDGDESIRIAEYGQSNIGQMKHIYRHGLWHRYGRTMQAIAGIHFNYSVPEHLWTFLHKQNAASQSLETYKNIAYFGLIRNFQRIGWIILYLFGASPAICKNFFKDRPSLMTQFEAFDSATLYYPYATSLRMSDIGYKSQNQAKLNIDYNTLEGYVESLSNAINTPYPDYEKIGIVDNNVYKQLNANVLQIENEFYSIIRPKQVAQSCEKPTVALKKRGVCYVEMRALDLNPFVPMGIDEQTARFIEALLLTCLLTESPPAHQKEQSAHNTNQLIVANNGRAPNVVLYRHEKTIQLKSWANEFLSAMHPICQALDLNENGQPYDNALKYAQTLIDQPDLTPSAQMLKAMSDHNASLGCFEIQQSRQHAAYFAQLPLDSTTKQTFITLAQDSHKKQQVLEESPQLPFDQFLAQYFLSD